MFWLVLAAQVAEALAAPTATASVQPDMDVTVERLPPGLKSPTLVRVAFSVGADGRASCAAAQTKDASGAENHPALVKIACAQIEWGFRATASKDATGKSIPSIRTALFQFSTDAPSQARGGP
ncbi:MAG: hypothetical protein H0V46_00470, partial [Sphingomonas sp.]|nr:hypothetical protein [Sphingomonas sp.]